MKHSFAKFVKNPINNFIKDVSIPKKQIIIHSESTSKNVPLFVHSSFHKLLKNKNYNDSWKYLDHLPTFIQWNLIKNWKVIWFKIFKIHVEQVNVEINNFKRSEPIVTTFKEFKGVINPKIIKQKIQVETRKKPHFIKIQYEKMHLTTPKNISVHYLKPTIHTPSIININLKPEEFFIIDSLKSLIFNHTINLDNVYDWNEWSKLMITFGLKNVINFIELNRSSLQIKHHIDGARLFWQIQDYLQTRANYFKQFLMIENYFKNYSSIYEQVINKTHHVKLHWSNNLSGKKDTYGYLINDVLTTSTLNLPKSLILALIKSINYRNNLAHSIIYDKNELQLFYELPNILNPILMWIKEHSNDDIIRLNQWYNYHKSQILTNKQNWSKTKWLEEGAKMFK